MPKAPTTRRSSSSTSLKQTTLSFGSFKRSNSSGVKSGNLKPAVPSPLTQKPIEVESSSDESDEIEEWTSGDDRRSEKHVEEEEARPARTLSSKAAQKQPETVATAVSETKTDDEELKITKPKHLKVNDKKYTNIWHDATEQMGTDEPIHGQHLNKIHNILRVFDFTYKYGPCQGVTRLERWERAESLGMNPPPEVKEILTTYEGMSDNRYKLTSVDQLWVKGDA